MTNFNVIDETELKQWLGNHSDWQMIDGEIQTEKTFDNFIQAFEFIGKVAILAEEHGHHPTIWNSYNKVRLSMNTHDADNKITDKDLKLAEAISK